MSSFLQWNVAQQLNTCRVDIRTFAILSVNLADQHHQCCRNALARRGRAGVSDNSTARCLARPGVDRFSRWPDPDQRKMHIEPRAGAALVAGPDEPAMVARCHARRKDHGRCLSPIGLVVKNGSNTRGMTPAFRKTRRCQTEGSPRFGSPLTKPDPLPSSLASGRAGLPFERLKRGDERPVCDFNDRSQCRTGCNPSEGDAGHIDHC